MVHAVLLQMVTYMSMVAVTLAIAAMVDCTNWQWALSSCWSGISFQQSLIQMVQ